MAVARPRASRSHGIDAVAVNCQRRLSETELRWAFQVRGLCFTLAVRPIPCRILRVNCRMEKWKRCECGHERLSLWLPNRKYARCVLPQLMCKRHRFAAPWPILVAPLVGSRGLQLVCSSCAHGAALAKGFLVRGGRTGSQVSSGGLTPKTYNGLQYDAVPSRSLTFQFRVVAEFFILHRRLPVCQVWQINGFFALFPAGKKVRVQVRARVGTECGLYSIHAASSAAVHVTSHGQGDLGEW